MADDHLKINDLPIECIAHILTFVKDRTDRTCSRFVCKLWRDLINQDSSSECYRIDLSRKIPKVNIFRRLFSRLHGSGSQPQIVTDDYTYKANSFLEVIPLFVCFHRRKVSFRFRKVDFHYNRSEEFWRRKGESIVSLEFEKKCRHIPLVEINRYCVKLRDLSINVNGFFDECRNSLENCAFLGSANRRVQNVRVIGADFRPVQVMIMTRLVDQVFPSTKKISFVGMTSFIDWSLDVNSLSTAFWDLKFTIALSSPRGRNLIIFDPSGQVPVKVKNLSIEASGSPNANNLAFNLSLYSNDLAYVEKLYLKIDESFEMSLVDEILSKCPSLNSLYVQDARRINSLENAPFEEGRRRLEFLEFDLDASIAIDDPFLHSFENLKSFKCFRLSYCDFYTLLDHLKRLKALCVYTGTIDATSSTAEPEVVSHCELIELECPTFFLHRPDTRYEFANLKCLILSVNHLESARQVDDMMTRIFCPRIETLRLGSLSGQRSDSEIEVEYVETMRTILSHFPTLMDLTYKAFDEVGPMSDVVLGRILRTHRRLKKIGSYYAPHTFNIISPWFIQHVWMGKECVLFVPQ